MPTVDHRNPFELCDAANMMDDADRVISAVHALGNPQGTVAEILSHVTNVGYILALQDMQLGIESLEKKLHGGHPAVTGMQMAAAKIEHVYGQVYDFMKGEAEKAGVDVEQLR